MALPGPSALLSLAADNTAVSWGTDLKGGRKRLTDEAMICDRISEQPQSNTRSSC